MPPLRDRAQPDTVARLERAAARRYAEATLLRATEPLGAIYLYGYSVEIRLKAAVYRLDRVPDHHDISLPVPPGVLAPRRRAEDRIKTLLVAAGTPSAALVGHHLLGWARLVEGARAASPLGPLPLTLARDFFAHVDLLWRIWAGFLRYAANKPYNREADDVSITARWLKIHYHQLWS